MQVRCLRDRLPAGARVGSVDKFQGQEAPVVILSLCSSTGEFGSRGLKFILDRNRLNVSISRAQSLAVVVGDPRIAENPAGSIEDMERINIFCKIRAQNTMEPHSLAPHPVQNNPQVECDTGQTLRRAP